MSSIDKEIAVSLADGSERDFWVMTSFRYEDRKRIYDVLGSLNFVDNTEETVEETVDLSTLFNL
jgi:hypothetical protein